MDAVLVNESRDIRRPGDVSVFRSVSDACAYLEPWWVEDGEGLVLSAQGDRIILGVLGTRVIETTREPFEEGAVLVSTWLRYLLSRQGIQQKEDASVSELLGIVTFD